MIDDAFVNLGYINRLANWCEGLSGDTSTWNGWNAQAIRHMVERLWSVIEISLCRCTDCGSVMALNAKYCPQCGQCVSSKKAAVFDGLATAAKQAFLEFDGIDDETETVFPSGGIYIYFHSTEGYKIGQAENVPRRMLKHQCSAPSLDLLHVIETSDLDWTERFIHKRYAHRRRHTNHEYFDLTYSDLSWLFSVKVLEPPRSHDAQMSLLDLL